MGEGNNRELPLFTQDKIIRDIFKDVIKSIPKGTKVYLVGGTVRNILYYRFFKKELPQRDYDLLLIGDEKKFINNLRKNKFVYGKIRRKYEITLKRKKFSQAKHVSDFVVLDIHLTHDNNVKRNIKEHSNFTINCNILSLKYINSENWYSKIISLSGAISDLKNKKLVVNALSHPAQILACIRLISNGFKKPSEEDIDLMLNDPQNNDRKDVYNRNIKKTIRYLGSKKKVIEIIKSLGLKENILRYKI